MFLFVILRKFHHCFEKFTICGLTKSKKIPTPFRVICKSVDFSYNEVQFSQKKSILWATGHYTLGTHLTDSKKK